MELGGFLFRWRGIVFPLFIVALAAVGYGGELADDYSQHEGNLSFRIDW